MATLRELILKISANSSSFQAEVSKASRISNDFYKNSASGSRQLRQELIQQKKALTEINGQLSSVAMTAKASAGALIGFFSASAAISTVDDWGQMSARIVMALKSVEGSAQRYDEIQQRFLTISNRNGKAIETTQELYIGTASAMKELNYNTTQTVDYIESMSSAFTANATSAQKTESALNAINKATIEGKVAGENWKAIMNATPSVLVDIAKELERTNGGMKVTESQVKKLAAEGKISFKLFADAMINAKDANNALADSMDNTFSDGFVRVANSAKSYLGELNKGAGATKTMSAALAYLSDNFDKVALAGGLIVGVGLSRYLGNLTLSTKNLAKETVNGYLSQVNHTREQVRALEVTKMRIQDERQLLIDTRHSLAAKKMVVTTDKERLILDGQLAKNTKALTALSNQETVANTKLAASRRALNSMTSVTSTIGRGLSGLLSLVGGLPGAIMLGAGAWYAVKQHQDAAHQSALEYANALDDIAARTKNMSLVQASDEAKNVQKTVDAQKKQIESIENAINYYRGSSAKYVIDSLNLNYSEEQRANFLRIAINETKKLQVEESRLLETQQGKQNAINVLNGLNDQANSIANKKAASMAQELAQESEFNRLISLGNNLLSNRQLLTNTPMSFGPLRVLPPTLDEKQSNFLTGAAREAQIAGLSQRDQVKQRSLWEAESMFPNDDRYTQYKNQYVNDKLKAHDDREKMNKSLKSGTSLMKEAERVTERYKDKIADLSVATEVQKVRALQGEKAAALYAAAHETGSKWAPEQRKEIEAHAVKLAEWTQRADEAVRKQREMADALKDLKEATKKFNDDAALNRETRGMSKRQTNFYEEAMQVDRVFNKTDKGADAIAAKQAALEALNTKYQESKAAELDWLAGTSSALADWMEDAKNYSQIAYDSVTSIANATTSSISGTLKDLANGTKSLGGAVSSTISDIGQSALSVLTDMTAKWLVYQGVQLAVGKTTQASAGTALFTNAQAMAKLAALNAYASTAAIPLIGPAMAPIAAASASAFAEPMAAGIGALSLSGMAHDGVDKVPETGTWLLQKGERVVTSQTSAKLDATLERVRNERNEQQAMQGSINPEINIHNSFSGKPDNATVQLIEAKNKQLVKQIIDGLTSEIIKPQNKFGNTLRHMYPNRSSIK
ncbi:phage tail tape measure protein [Providencia rettgeri]|uniref:tape measure protein n=1 Tax=Providencia rettgeri TaxID=587 RepID=UPI001C82DF17|nr:tape measure protein [Providencia rettgeri]MBX6968269.1 phage tail tape measure protein [Providencia rettgeri]MBX6977986.1 phage tail tape measure protein [Providencia rettgeri]MBX6994999.1 phage tail tape measure protein [Providencia rettgeri]MBX6996134.1 phage tail tape measure protein [Providencia rettgeri]MBX7023694.1 phage tail tape measure protein [Providencia rettgeri]